MKNTKNNKKTKVAPKAQFISVRAEFGDHNVAETSLPMPRGGLPPKTLATMLRDKWRYINRAVATYPDEACVALSWHPATRRVTVQNVENV